MLDHIRERRSPDVRNKPNWIFLLWLCWWIVSILGAISCREATRLDLYVSGGEINVAKIRSITPVAGPEEALDWSGSARGCRKRMTNVITVTRRDLVKSVGLSGVALTLLQWPKLYGLGDDSGWVKYEGNPVLGGQYGTCFDICVLLESGTFRMWVSWRPKQSVAITESKDGIHWSPPEIVLPPNPATGWEDDINRPVIVHRDDGYHMWYTGQAKGKSKIGYATSPDGWIWKRQSRTPVLESSASWEGVAVMCPHVNWDERARTWKMWYSGGDQYEPNAIGYATSSDGVHWNKHASNPVLTPDSRNEWEKERVTAAQVIYLKGWYYALYIGFRDIDHAQIGMARSKNGVDGWIRHARNPIVSPTPRGWDADACYKPYAVYADKQWRLWYNGRHEHLEQIGLVLHRGEDLGFVAES